MKKHTPKHEDGQAESKAQDDAQRDPVAKPAAENMPKEIGGRDGPDPTRYGDWEKAGRCIDF